MRVPRCKGTRDLSPGEMAGFRRIEGAFRESCLGWGYAEVRTPILEYLHLFTSAGRLTPSMLSKVYSFLDWDGWSGERVVLRPDGTIPVARFYLDNMESAGLARLFYVESVFIFEETGREPRERWQCGAELIGGGSPLAEVELVALALEVLERLGIDGVEVRLSHAGLVRELLGRLGLSSKEQHKIFERVLDGDAEALAGLKIGKKGLARALPPLLDLKGKSSGFLKNLKALFPPELDGLKAGMDNFIAIVELLESLGCHYQIDLASGRGFEYYTGLIFQLFKDGEKVGGGGRYDALIPQMGGRDVPASGFALYLDRLMSRLVPETLDSPARSGVLVRVAPEALKAGFSLAGALREAGYVARLDLGREPPGVVAWVLDVQKENLILTDQACERRFEAKSAAEILALLRGQGGNQDSPA